MPLTKKGAKVMRAMSKTYPSKKVAQRVFYASVNSGRIKGVERKGRRKR
jgi:hypothetical protein